MAEVQPGPEGPHGRARCPDRDRASIEHMFDTVVMTRRPHPRLAAAHARQAETMRQAAQQLREEHGPIKPDVRSGLARLLEAVADERGQATTYICDGASAVANAVLARPLDEGIVDAIRKERAGLTDGR
jgi:hypothetical protein